MEKFWNIYKEAPNPRTKQNLIRHRCKHDLRFFAKIFFPHYCTSPFNLFHEEYFKKWAFGERKSKRAWAAPRGAAKSTIPGFIKLIHDLCYHSEYFIVVLSNTESLAIQKLKDIRSEIINNTKLIGHYDLSFVDKVPGESMFTAQSRFGQTRFMAFGRGAQIRGVKFGPYRPSKVVCDDVEHSEEVYNERTRSKTLAWFREDVSKIGNESTNLEFIGTVLHRESLLKNLLSNPAYEGEIYQSVISWSERQDLWEQWKRIYTNLDNPARREESDAFYQANEKDLLQGTKVLWPEKEPYLYLMKEMVEIGRLSFFKEKQNQPLGAEEKIFDKLHWYRETPEGLLIESSNTLITWPTIKESAYATIDPATGQTKAKKGRLGDYTCILSGYKDPKGRLLVHEDWTKRAPPTKYIQEIFSHHERFNYQKFGVETNLYRNLLLPNIIEERKRREQAKGASIRLPFYDIEQTENKQERVYRLEPKVSHGYILFNRSLSETFKTMLEDFPHADHDDGPDALEALWNLVNNRYQVASVSVDPMSR
jgi:predicted phage terminase large subunit-like protein